VLSQNTVWQILNKNFNYTMHLSILFLAIVTCLAGAQRPSGTSVCDYYTNALLKSNTAATQYQFMTLLVNTAMIGNYSTINGAEMHAVTGILNKGNYAGTTVNLLPYFDGSQKSSNVGNQAQAVNYLDDGGAAPLLQSKPSANNNASRQRYVLRSNGPVFKLTESQCLIHSSLRVLWYPLWLHSNESG
jgi:hypothetical protein